MVVLRYSCFRAEEDLTELLEVHHVKSLPTNERGMRAGRCGAGVVGKVDLSSGYDLEVLIFLKMSATSLDSTRGILKIFLRVSAKV